MSKQTVVTAAWTKTRERVLAIEREAREAAADYLARQERDALPTKHELLRRMLFSLLGGHGST